jgi:serine/threonine protein kinase
MCIVSEMCEVLAGQLIGVLWRKSRFEQVYAIFSQVLVATVLMSADGISHNDLHLDNVMLSRTPIQSVIVRTPGRSVCFPTFGWCVKVIDFGLSTWRFADGSTLNADSLSRVGYAVTPNADLRTIALDLATRQQEVWPPRPEDPTGSDHLRDMQDPYYAALTKAVVALCAFQGGGPRGLLHFLDHPELLPADDEDLDQDDAFDKLFISLRAIANDGTLQFERLSIEFAQRLLTPWPEAAETDDTARSSFIIDVQTMNLERAQ